MKTPHSAPAVSPRQQTLSHLLSGKGLASSDSELLKKICVALAEDAEDDYRDFTPHPATLNRGYARACPSQR